jgi:site-specific DNA recombinase
MSKQEYISATEEMMKQLGIVMSKYYSNAISESTKRGMLHRVKNGYAVSRPPLGYSVTEMPGFFKVNRRGRALRETLKKLANGETNIESATFNIALMFYGLNTLKSWSTIRTKRLLSDPYYAGWISYKGQLYRGQHEALITKEEHELLLDLLHDVEVANSLKSVDKSLQKH